MRTLTVPDVSPSSSIRRRCGTPPGSCRRARVTSTAKPGPLMPWRAKSASTSRSMWARTRPSRLTIATGRKSRVGPGALPCSDELVDRIARDAAVVGGGRSAIGLSPGEAEAIDNNLSSNYYYQSSGTTTQEPAT